MRKKIFYILMDSNSNIDYDILFRYFEQKATLEEQELIREWEKDVDKRSEIEEAYQIWYNSNKEELVLKDEELEVLFDKNTKKYKSHLLKKSFLYYCVVTLGLLSTMFIFNHYQYRNKEGLFIVKTMNNKLGNTEVWLSDSTHVVLSKGSVLKLWDVQDKKHYRAVQLRGKGFFDVAKNKEKPFLIETGTDMVVKVLGTSFVLNTDSSNLDLGLISGKVELLESNKLNDKTASSTIVKPGQHIHLKSNEKENILNIDSLNVKVAIKWTKPVLDFQAMPLGRILDNLSAYYNIPIECSEELKNKYHCTIQIADESLSETMHILETTLPLKIVNNDVKINVIEK